MFQFKKFTIAQDKCAMKVGTDGVLLGAWATIAHDPQAILDIGTGTGLIALMLAQRCEAPQIDAIEIDSLAYEQAVENFENSPWNNRLFCYHADLEHFAHEMDDEYDLIVSNPPFYSENYKTGDPKRNQARFQHALPFELLIEAVDYFLSEKGVFCVIVPAKEEEKIIQIAAEFHIFPLKVTRVQGNYKSEIKRSLLAFTRNLIAKIPLDVLVLESERHTYTDDFKELTKNFYLKK